MELSKEQKQIELQKMALEFGMMSDEKKFQLVCRAMDQVNKLEDELSQVKKAVYRADWFIDHIMGEKKRVNWGETFDINWGEVNLALIEVSKAAQLLRIKYEV